MQVRAFSGRQWDIRRKTANRVRLKISHRFITEDIKAKKRRILRNKKFRFWCAKANEVSGGDWPVQRIALRSQRFLRRLSEVLESGEADLGASFVVNGIIFKIGGGWDLARDEKRRDLR